MTYDELQELSAQMRKCRQASRRNPEALEELEQLNRIITNIANAQCATNAEVGRQITAIESSIATLRKTTFGKRQA